MTATYIYCVVAAARPPQAKGAPRGLAGMRRPRVLAIDRGLFAVVADAPLKQYGEAAIRKGLSDLDWVSRAAMAHEAVVEHFIDARAVLPMKLFALFANDERALAYLRGERRQLATKARGVADHVEWGVRVHLDREKAVAGALRPDRRRSSGVTTGVAYLARKKAARDAGLELATQAQETVAALYDRLAGQARRARRRSASELPIEGGSLVLDAAFLVPRSRTRAFRALIGREGKALAPRGYVVTLTGPWPPYTFVQD